MHSQSQRAARRFNVQPLFAQVRDLLLDRIALGEFAPGSAIPNEIVLGQELGVSNGTIRKALRLLEDDKVLVRRQGKGTFVADHSAREHMTRYSNIRDAAGLPIVPDVEVQSFERVNASAEACQKLKLDERQTVFEISRVYSHKGKPYLTETCYLPQYLFPNLLPNEASRHICSLAQKFKLLIADGKEEISIGGANAETARGLQMEKDAPVLILDRLLFDVRDQPVEWRRASCNLSTPHYVADLH